MIVAITGATGFIGPHLIQRLQRAGHAPRILGRRDPGLPGVEFVPWDSGREPSAESLQDAGAVIHLAGEPVGQRWTADVKKRIRETRVRGTHHLVSAISRLRTRPRVLVGASAIGYYGSRGDEVLTEAAPPGKDFLAGVCAEWEHENLRAREYGVRVVLPRIGIVLGREGGALKQLLPPFRAGLGGPAGNGRQWMSWIHIHDIVELVLFVIDREISGPVNAVSPDPLRNAEFAKKLGAALHRPTVVPTPALAIKLMFGEMAEVVLASQRVIPEVAIRAGFTYRYTDVEEALRDVVEGR